MTSDPELGALMRRIAEALERLAPLPPAKPDFEAADAFVWSAGEGRFQPVTRVNRMPLDLLQGIDRQSDLLLENTQRFANGLPANNALLWGARGMGKSSLVKAAHAAVLERRGCDAAAAQPANKQMAAPARLKLIEIHREDISSLPHCLANLGATAHRFIVFCDDLSFDNDDTDYKSLKAVLEGGLEGRPDNVLFYATSNRRHLMPRDMMENERSTAINPSEAVEEKVSLSDRFGLWLGFHNCSQEQYLTMVAAYSAHFGLAKIRDGALPPELRAQALEWSTTRGARSGRVAWQFIQDLAGREGKQLR